MADGRVLVAGGWDGVRSISDVEFFDPAMNSWQATARMGKPRWGHTATTLLDGRVLVAGGVGADDLPTEIVEIFMPDTGIAVLTVSAIYLPSR
jgi:hypothetical protein